MILLILARKTFLPLVAAILLLFCFAACGHAPSQAHASANAQHHIHSSAHPGKTATPTRPPALMIVFLGTPTATKSANGTFTVNGQFQNTDSRQRSVTLQATLLDASGNPLATATQTIAAPASATATYNITGTTTTAKWSNVVVSVVKLGGN